MKFCSAALFFSFILATPSVYGFSPATGNSRLTVYQALSQTSEPEINVLWEDEEDEEPEEQPRLKSSRWDNLNPKIKARIVKKGQERAMANKKKVEPLQDKKRREYRSRSVCCALPPNHSLTITIPLDFHRHDDVCQGPTTPKETRLTRPTPPRF